MLILVYLTNLASTQESVPAYSVDQSQDALQVIEERSKELKVGNGIVLSSHVVDPPPSLVTGPQNRF